VWTFRPVLAVLLTSVSFATIYAGMLLSALVVRSAALSGAVCLLLFILGIVAGQRASIMRVWNEGVMRELFAGLTLLVPRTSTLGTAAADLASGKPLPRRSHHLHVDASHDVGIVAAATGAGQDTGDLGKAVGSALTLGRLAAQTQGNKDLAEVLDYARVSLTAPARASAPSWPCRSSSSRRSCATARGGRRRAPSPLRSVRRRSRVSPAALYPALRQDTSSRPSMKQRTYRVDRQPETHRRQARLREDDQPIQGRILSTLE
jgi:hypothetical protein